MSAHSYDPFGMMMPHPQNSQAGGHSFGFQGQLADDEMHGNQNSYAFKYRMHDPRIGRFFSVDPLAKKYPHNSPYAFSENRLIDGYEWEGLEYKDAANWASNNLEESNWPSTRTIPERWDDVRNSNEAVLDVKDDAYCYEATLTAYAQGNGLVAEYIDQQGGLPDDRADGSGDGALGWFKSGGRNHSFISSDDFQKAGKGDIMFAGSHVSFRGHAAILAKSPEETDGGNLKVVLWTTTGDDDGTFGKQSWTFSKNEEGDWTLGQGGYELKGFGRIDQEQIETEAKLDEELKEFEKELEEFEEEGENNGGSESGG